MVLLVPELTFLMGLSDVQRNSRVVKELTRKMVQSPRQHYTRLTNLLRRIRDTPDASQELEHWGLCLDVDIHRVQGHILPAERVNLGHRSFFPGNDLSWHKEVIKEVSISVISLHSWCLVYPKRLQHVVKDLLAAVSSTCGPLGMQVAQPMMQELRDDRVETYVKTIRSILGSQDKMQLLLCLIPNNRDDLYGAIKKLCCVQAPVPSQVITAQSLLSHPGKIRSVVQKVLLQVNCKLGGELWRVEIPLKQLMVVGMDIHHSQSQGIRSVVGFVASMNQYVLAWAWGRWISSHLALQLNHTLPLRIVVYRDGVADSQLDTVLKYEIPQMQKSFEAFDNYHPSLVVMVVQKQINISFYNLMGTEFLSPPAGTVIDHTITSSGWQDFFLLAHHSQQGCSIPTRYVCLWNTAQLSCEHLQR
ncbi:Piwi-like 2 [Acanthisitta chloris]|nr:Piwi-like 2 [Acanthisitta chloris]